MAKLNKKIIAAALGVAAVGVTVPVVLTSCAQTTSDQNSGTGQDSVNNNAVVSTDGNSYNGAIVLDGASSVETVKAYFTENAAAVESVKSSLLNDKTRFNHVDMEFKDVVKTAEDSYSLVFESVLADGYKYADGSTTEKNINVALTNVSFKDATVKASYNYDAAINVYEINEIESLTALQNYLTKDNNKVLNQIVDSSLGIVAKDSSNVGSVKYVANSINKVGNSYQITLLAETKAKHLFSDGSNQKSITLNLTNPQFALLGAASSTGIWYLSNTGQGATAELKTMMASKESAVEWMSKESTLSWLSTQLSNDLFKQVEVTSLVDGSVQLVGDSGFVAQVVVSGKGRYVFENGVKTKTMKVEFKDAGWQYNRAIANDSAVATGSSTLLGWNQIVNNQEPSQTLAEKFVEAYDGNPKTMNHIKANGGLTNVASLSNKKVTLLSNGDVRVSYIATSNMFTRFENGSRTKEVAVVITNLPWKKEASIKRDANGDVRFDAKNISWFTGKKGDTTNLVRDWLLYNGGIKEVESNFLEQGVIKNATLSVALVGGRSSTNNHIQVQVHVKANDGFKFADGSDSKQIEIWIDNMPW